VRTLAYAALALVAGLVAAPSVAHADQDDDDPDGDFVPFRTRSIAIGGYGHGTRVGGQSEGGFGPTLELAYGRGRWQYLAEGSYASSSFDDPNAPPATTSTERMRIDGHVWRGALGARFLARQFMPDSSGGVELFLLSLVGMEHFHYSGGAKLTRPEVALGMGVQGRVYKKPHLAFRLDVRLLFTPNDRDSALVSCRDLCSKDPGSNTGFMTGIAFAW
jgi:hypothetical protein